MKWLPFDHLIVSTPLSVQEIRSQLLRNVGPVKKDVASLFSMNSLPVFNKGMQEKMSDAMSFPFKGWVDDDHFKFSCNSGYRNSFSPFIIGEVAETENGSIINIRLRMDWFVFGLTCLWLIPVGLLTLLMLMALINTGRFDEFLFIPLSMFLFGYGLMVFGFNTDRKAALDLIYIILKGNPVDTIKS
jgi:hypothetical protein